MPGIAVKVLLLSVVLITIIGEIRGPSSPSRTRSDRTRGSFFQRLQSGLSARTTRRSSSPRRNDHEAGSSGIRGNNDDEAGSSRGRRSRSRSSSPDLQILPGPPPATLQPALALVAGPSRGRSRSRSSSPDLQILPGPPPATRQPALALVAGPSRGRSRSRSSSPDLQILPGPPPATRQPSLTLAAGQPPFPWVTTSITTAKNQNEKELIRRFAEMHVNPGDPEMTLADFKAKKNSLLRKLNEDTCSTDKRGGGNKCALALKEFKEITSKWRGPCGDAFMALCQPWGTAGWRCSFFMKTSVGYYPPIKGYSHTMHDCVNALSPDEFERATTKMVDSWIG